ncbi:hypothetical protein [Gluconobacter cerinus]|uniref:hypothetical protein n=1 Tax=Gluconobacter cerinus TaxID=38307 RepID=UPI001B8D2B70|nr:hypothetical protein [Gluconobacter cerinus]MBS1038077.1 hypothetical protein [Gluconobacter cerinus]
MEIDRSYLRNLFKELDKIKFQQAKVTDFKKYSNFDGKFFSISEDEFYSDAKYAEIFEEIVLSKISEASEIRKTALEVLEKWKEFFDLSIEQKIKDQNIPVIFYKSPAFRDKSNLKDRYENINPFCFIANVKFWDGYKRDIFEDFNMIILKKYKKEINIYRIKNIIEILQDKINSIPELEAKLLIKLMEVTNERK